MAKAKTTETTGNELVVQTDAPPPMVVSNTLPAYLTGQESSGLEAFKREDFNIPQVRLLYPVNNEVKQYPGIAIPGEYWHTGLVRSMGNRFNSVICVARKRVILWRPRTDNNGGILASSNDSVNWDRGANTEFTVKLKDVKDPVKWNTGPNVKASGLLHFGSSIPGVEDSKPAAVLYYEYVVYLPEMDGASPVVMRFSKTGVDTAKNLNAYFLLQQQRKVPIYACGVEWFTGTKTGPEGEYFLPRFNPKGYVEKQLFDITHEMHKQYADIELAIEQEPDNEVAEDTGGNAPAY